MNMILYSGSRSPIQVGIDPTRIPFTACALIQVQIMVTRSVGFSGALFQFSVGLAITIAAIQPRQCGSNFQKNKVRT